MGFRVGCFVPGHRAVEDVGKFQRAAVVKWYRASQGEIDGSRILIPDELTDIALMGLFPGRTLEELDDVDLVRLERVLQAKRVIEIEAKRDQYNRGRIGNDVMTDDDWSMIRQHDEWIGNGIE